MSIELTPSAPRRTREAMEGVLRCYRERFPGANVFSIRFPIKVFWGSVSILEASQSNSDTLWGKAGATKAVYRVTILVRENLLLTLILDIPPSCLGSRQLQ